MQSCRPWWRGCAVTASPRLEVAPRRSRLALTLWAAAAVGVGVGLSTLALPWWLRVLLLMALLGGGRDVLWPRAVRETLLWDGSAWRLVRGDIADALDDFRWEFVSRWLVVPSFREGRRRRYRPVFADAVAPEVFRALLVMARSAAPVPD